MNETFVVRFLVLLDHEFASIKLDCIQVFGGALALKATYVGVQIWILAGEAASEPAERSIIEGVTVHVLDGFDGHLDQFAVV